MWFWVVVAVFVTPVLLLPEREIDGEAFCHLSGEDIATIFPPPKQFILASKLYKVVQEKKKRHSDESSRGVECSAFKLPVFSPDIRNCISLLSNQANPTTNQRVVYLSHST